MNYDPVKFCFQCQTPRPRQSFRVLHGLKRKRDDREVCELCYTRVMEARLKIQQESMKKDTTPF